MADYQQYRKTAFKEPVVWGEGRPRRPMVMGFAPATVEEKRPFTEGNNLVLRSVLGRMGVPDSYLYFNYLFKTPTATDDQRLFNVMFLDDHVGCANKEIDLWLQPATLVLLGAEAFRNLFFLPERDVEKLRRIRFQQEVRPLLSIFVTYSTDEVSKAYDDQRWDVVQNFQEDLMGIFECNRALFPRTKKLETFNHA